MPDGAVSPWGMLLPNKHLIAIAMFGGFVLFGSKLTDHYSSIVYRRQRYINLLTAMQP